MKKLTQKIITLALLHSVFFVNMAHAQEVSTPPAEPPVVEVAPALVEAPEPAVVEESPAEVVAADPVEVPVAVQDTEEALQDAAPAQDAVVSGVIESTINPETIEINQSSVTELLVSEPTTPASAEPVPVEEAPVPEVPLEGEAVPLEVVLEDIATPNSVEETVPVPVLSNDIIETPLAVLAPEPTYAFEVTGKQIPTRRTIKNNEGVIIGEDVVTNILVPQVDNAKGEVSVSGECSDAYYVVLLFKNSTDYLNDPRSYIFNSAYPCVGGMFSYAISTLPNNLPNGTYYILIGEQGRKGAWKPVTSLTEVTINRAN